MALGTRTKFNMFKLEILIRTTINAIHKFQENILESLQNVSETTPRVYPECSVLFYRIHLLTHQRDWESSWEPAQPSAQGCAYVFSHQSWPTWRYPREDYTTGYMRFCHQSHDLGDDQRHHSGYLEIQGPLEKKQMDNIKPFSLICTIGAVIFQNGRGRHYSDLNSLRTTVLSKVQIPRSPNGPPMVDDWVVRITFGWSVYVVVRNDNKTLNIN